MESSNTSSQNATIQGGSGIQSVFFCANGSKIYIYGLAVFFPERAVSIGYYALVEYSLVAPKTDLFTDECRWWDVTEIPDLLFDHNDIVSTALKTLRRQFDYQPIGFNLLPEKFTLIELQKLHETVLGHPLDRGNFQKKMLSYGFLERQEERKTGGAHKAPYLYRFDAEKYETYLRDNE